MDLSVGGDITRLNNECTQEFSDKVVKNMKGPYAGIAKSDRLILKFGQSYFVGHMPVRAVYELRKKMYVCAEMVVEGRKVNANNGMTFDDLLSQNNYGTIVDVIKKIGVIGESMCDAFCKPHKAVFAVNTLKAAIHFKMAVNPSDATLSYLAGQIEGPDFRRYVHKFIRNGQRVMRSAKVVVLPKRNDVIMLLDSLKVVIRTEVANIKETSCVDEVEWFAKRLLSYVIVYNKTRANEPNELKVKDYHDTVCNVHDSLAEEQVNVEEAEVAELYMSRWKVEVVSNKNKVLTHIYLDELAKNGMEALIRWHKASVPSDKIDMILIFSAPSSDISPIEGTRAINQTINVIQHYRKNHRLPTLEKPELLRTRLFRKAFASEGDHSRRQVGRETIVRQLNHTAETHNRHYIVQSTAKQMANAVEAIEVFHKRIVDDCEENCERLPTTSKGTFSKRKRIRIDYSEDEKKELFQHFRDYIDKEKLPPSAELEDYLQGLEDSNRLKIAGVKKVRECVRNYLRKNSNTDDKI